MPVCNLLQWLSQVIATETPRNASGARVVTVCTRFVRTRGRGGHATCSAQKPRAPATAKKGALALAIFSRDDPL